MRRDYFICVFLFCICASLFFVCFAPLMFEYAAIIPREFTVFEMIMSWLFAVVVLVAIPLYSAIFKKFWFTCGIAAYGLFANIPEWVIPKLMNKVQGDDASITAVVANYILRAIYGMVKAPFAGISPALGTNFAVALSKWILPVSLGSYFLVQLFRYYKDAYIASQLDPSRAVDSTAAENHSSAVASRRREAQKAEILGTVISAPVTKTPQKTATPATTVAPPSTTSKATSQVFPVNPNSSASNAIPDSTLAGGNTQRVHMVREPKISSDTQVIQLGPPKTDK